MLKFLYRTIIGRCFLKILTAPWLSKTAGRFLDTRISARLIPSFIKSNNIDLTEVDMRSWASFNDFFTRQLVTCARPVNQDSDKLISPCDAFLKIYDIAGGCPVTVKDVPYSIEELLKDRDLAGYYDGGLCLVFRLCPAHYHRYIYPESGHKSPETVIRGAFHTVRPIATQSRPVFAENTRNYSVIDSSSFGQVIFMQVGALLVGRIVSDEPGTANVTRGTEAGRFEFGGSTIVMLLQKGRAEIFDGIKKASAEGSEYPVKLGEAIGCIAERK